MKTANRVALGLACLVVGRIASGADLYTCQTAAGSVGDNRPITGCIGPQKKNNVEMAAPLTPREIAAEKEVARLAAIAEQKRRDAIRADEQLLDHYPDESAHRKAREAELAPIRTSQDDLRKQLLRLASERVPLMNEAAFYKAKDAQPPKLRDALASSDTKVAAAEEGLVRLQHDERDVNARRDAELDRLRKLWAQRHADRWRPFRAGRVRARTSLAASSRAASQPPVLRGPWPHSLRLPT